LMNAQNRLIDVRASSDGPNLAHAELMMQKDQVT
jgi:hypothetical protein